ncbi:unnamed protein product [Paramecium octaurelia]|uniref:MORN repeat protein n=1 Tax=Paramecium octaurelia TaxID=43137 RepID=A0A8S1XRQ2_PAROT|nr:unnamed protein product [Paramecium octaurelia]
MGNCQQCDNTDPIKTQEILTSKTTKSKQSKKITKNDLKGIIKIQANIRGFITRKKYKFKSSGSTAQKYGTSINQQKSSQNDSVIADSYQIAFKAQQIQQLQRRQSPIKILDQDDHRQLCEADVTINIHKDEDASSYSEVRSKHLISFQMNELCFIPIHKKDQKRVQNEEQQKLSILQMKNGCYYEGQWKKGMVHGFGKYTLSETSFYIGEWIENKANGFGTFQHSNGDLYVGSWKDGTANGNGKYTFTDGTYYDGQWNNDLPNGQGKQTYEGGWIYEGSFQNGFKSGFGQLTYPDGTVYAGKFENDLMNGYGILKFPDGRTYNGEWKNGLKSGKGVFLWPDGRKYEGQFLNDQREGYGVLMWSNGQKYSGLWKEGLQHGNGQIIKANGATFRGRWIKGKIISTKFTTNTPAKVIKLVNG